MISPVFLHRSLIFMRSRLSRPSASPRRDFKVDSLLDKKLKERREAATGDAGGPCSSSTPGGFMTLTFLGFYDKRRERPAERVGVELLLVRLSHKKRKDSTSPAVQTSLGTSEVPVNPSEDHPPAKAPALSIPSESFSLQAEAGGGHQVKSYTLVVRVHHSPFIQVGD